MIAIHTRYISATNTRGARIKAYTGDKRALTVSMDYALDGMERHHKAARAFIARFLPYQSPDAPMCYGDSADGRGYVFCFSESKVTA